MKLYFFKDTYDNVVTEETALDLSWSDAVELFRQREVIERKDQVNLFIPAHFAVPQDGSVRRLSEHVSSITAVVLDFDGGRTLDQVIPQLEGIKHLGYTSHSHLKDGVTHKFRVLIPLVDPCPVEEWRQRRHDVINLFGVDDHSTTCVARAFYLPSCPAELLNCSFEWDMEGQELDWRTLKAKPLPPPPPPLDLSNLVDEGVGPVVWESFDMVQFFKDQGLYLSPAGGNKHNVLCPNRMHRDGGTVIWQDGVTPAKFYCSHTKCQGFNLGQFFTQKTGGWEWKTKYCKREKPRDTDSIAKAILEIKNNRRGRYGTR